MANVWKTTDKKIIMNFADDYMKYLDCSKTERLCVKYTEELAKKEGYVNLDSVSSLKCGDKVYVLNRNKNITLCKIGSEPITNGINIIASHVDSPRFDIKQNPLYEDSAFAMMDTHYYGGVRKYQWVAMPLSLIGVVITADGKTVEINIGEDENDPVFTFTDLLPHLSRDQRSQKLGDAFPPEALDVLTGSIPHDDEDKNVKDLILEIFKEKYNIEEEDFKCAELEIVPSLKAKSVGLDSSMIGAYGQDDRVCAYTSLKALFDTENVTRTSVCILADKEEVGSEGNTGIKSKHFENLIAELIEKATGSCSNMDLRRTLSKSMCLSADVAATYDPVYKGVFEKNNSALAGCGIAICKYTGSGGKSGTNDAGAEFMAKIRKIFNDNNIIWQTCEMGKVEQGGGGTVAKFIAALDVDTIDAGVPVLSMHSPFEVTSKADVYMSYKAYQAFYQAK